MPENEKKKKKKKVPKTFPTDKPGVRRTHIIGDVSSKPMTAEQKATAKAHEGARRISAEFKKRGTVEVRRMGTHKEVETLEDRPEVLKQREEEQKAKPRDVQLLEKIFTDYKQGEFRKNLQKDVTGEQIVTATALGLTLATGGVGLAKWSAGKAIAGVMGTGAASTLSRAAAGQVSQKIIQRVSLGGGRTLINTYNTGKTVSWLSKFSQFARTPTGIVSLIGSYPFAGFIKEEALQTLGMGFESAWWNDDAEGMDAALEMESELLDPNIWSQIFAAVPYANVLKELRSYYEAARIKHDINNKRRDSKLEKKAEELEND